MHVPHAVCAYQYKAGKTGAHRALHISHLRRLECHDTARSIQQNIGYRMSKAFAYVYHHATRNTGFTQAEAPCNPYSF